MTWSIAHEMTFTAAANTTAAKHDAGGPLKYHFETFLPAHGWTVTAEGESGGLTINADEKWYGLTKTNTYADGNSETFSLVVSLEYGSSEDVEYYTWNGVPGSGASSSLLFADSSSVPYPSAFTTTKWKWLVSDEDNDAWILLGELGNVLQGCGGSLPSAFFLKAGTSPAHNFWAPFCAGDHLEVLAGFAPFTGIPGNFGTTARILNPNWALSASSSSSIIGFNAMTDMMVKSAVTTASNTNINGRDPSSLLIGSDYWLDLEPGSTCSMLLKTGATDMGIF